METKMKIFKQKGEISMKKKALLPKKVAKQLKKMKLRIGTKTDYLVYTM